MKVDVVAYNAAISVLSRVSPVPWIQALQLFQEMQQRRMEANKKTYGALAKAFERGWGVKDAFFGSRECCGEGCVTRNSI